jgi:arsenite methyltransferase
MPRLSLLPVLMREVVGPRSLPREPEPDLVMDDEAQVQAYSEAGRIDGVMAAAYLFHTARVSQVLGDAVEVLDLGCGPATQLAQIAELNPRRHFFGVDLSEEMRASAERYVAERDLSNVTVRRDDITRLETVPDASVDAVISTMALHHLPTTAYLHACFRQIRRVLRPGGALYLVDFGRLKSLRSVLYFAYMNRKHQPHIFSLDYERSLRAAFQLEDFEAALAELPDHARILSTFLVPFLVVIKTADHPLAPEVRERLRAMRRDLPRRYRSDLDEIRRFFGLGGLSDDPFRG